MSVTASTSQTDATLAELTRELLRVGGARLLDEDLEQLDANAVARSLLLAFHEAYGGKTLRAVLTDPYFATWLDECCSRSDCDGLVVQLRVWLGVRASHSAGVDDPSRLVAIDRIPRLYAKLLRWAEEHHVLQELQRPAEELVRDRPELTRGVSLLEAALQPGELQCAAQAYLEDRAAVARGPQTRRRLWLRAEPSDTLRLLSTRLRELLGAVPSSEIERWRFVPTQPVTVDATSGRCRGSGSLQHRVGRARP